MNRVCLVGRLTRDPQLTETANGKTRARFTLAVDGFKNAQGERQADFIPVTAWDKTAVLLGQYTQKGKRVGVTGRLRTWTREVDGQTRYEMEVAADSIEFLSEKDGGKAGTSVATHTPDTQARVQQEADDEEDLPF